MLQVHGGMTHDMAAISGVSLAAYIMEQVIAADTYAAVSCALAASQKHMSVIAALLFHRFPAKPLNHVVGKGTQYL